MNRSDPVCPNSDACIPSRTKTRFQFAASTTRWRSCPNHSPATSIHEAIISSVVVEFAPSYIEGEIIEHEEEIATETGTAVTEVCRLWLVMRESLQLYPMDAVPEEVRQLVDHDDEPWRSDPMLSLAPSVAWSPSAAKSARAPLRSLRSNWRLKDRADQSARPW